MLHERELILDVKTKIVQAAQARLWLYGYKKTTIDEIAADAGIGKGTIYLYFDSKEAIAVEIVTQFKKETLFQSWGIAADESKSLLVRLQEILILPVLAAHERYSRSPATLEMVTALRPNIREHLKPVLEEELDLISSVLAQGNSAGVFAIDDTRQLAQVLKNMCHGFWPPYPCYTETEEITAAIGAMVALAYRGFAARTGANETI